MDSNNQLLSGLDDLLNEKCAAEKVTGMALMVSKNGEPIYDHFYGYRDIERELPINKDTIFGVASITKSFAALAIMQLVDAKKLSADDLVIKWLPEFKTPNNQYLDQIQVRHFMSHSSGLPGMEAVNRARALSKASDPDGEYLSGQLALLSSGQPIKNVVGLMNAMADMDYELLGPPGTRFNYSNEGFAMLQEIIERASGKPFIKYMNEHILEPLEMSRSIFLTEELQDFDNVTELYAYKHEKDGTFHSPAWWDVGDIYSNGSLKTTAADLMNYLEVYRNNGVVHGRRIISEESLREMTTIQFNTPTGRGYGYGLQIDQQHGIEFIGHGGSIKGVSSHMKVVPSKGISSIVLVNLADVAVEDVLMTALSHIIDIPAPHASHIPTFDVEGEKLQKYVGYYESAEGQKVEFLLEDNQLMMKAQNVKTKMRSYEEDGFISADGEKIKFLHDEHDNVTGAFKGLRFIPKVK